MLVHQLPDLAVGQPAALIKCRTSERGTWTVRQSSTAMTNTSNRGSFSKGHPITAESEPCRRRLSRKSALSM